MVVPRKITYAIVWIVSWTSRFFTEHHFYLKVQVACSVVPDSLQPHGLYSPWNSPGQNTGVGSLSLLQGIFLTQGWNPGLLHCRQILYQLNHKRSPRILELVAYPFSGRFYRPRNQTQVSRIAGRFFTSWTTREAQKYWSGYPFLYPGDRPNPGIKPRSHALQGESLPAEPQGKPKNTGVGSLSLLQGIFPTQELNRGLLHCRRILYQLSCT